MTINVAPMAHVHDIYEPKSIEKVLILPQQKDAMQDEHLILVLAWLNFFCHNEKSYLTHMLAWC